jgi:F-type H+-transporting ATPase subunit epsilon
MNLKVLIPEQILLDKEVRKITAEGQDGSFCILPRHVDFLSALAPGLLSYETEEAGEEFMALDEGILVKRGSEVLVSSRRAVLGPDLEKLKETVEKQFKIRDEHEQKAAMAMTKLEVSFMRHIMDLEKT